jgi:hypothetical protein
MNNIYELISFAQLRQLRTRDVSEPINEVPSSDNLLIHRGLIRIERYITERDYFLLNHRYVAKLNHTPGIDDVFYQFTVFDFWSGREM